MSNLPWAARPAPDRMTRRAAGALVAGWLAAGLAGGAAAQEYPNRPIRLVVPNTPGTIADIFGRALAQEMARTLGQPIVVENRAGANGTIGLEYVIKQLPADGYVFISTAVTALAGLPVTVKELRFDPLKDIPPFIGVAEGPYVFGSPAAAPWKSFAELVAHAKANPGKLNYGSPGTTVRLPMEALVRALGVQVVHVPYTGGAPYMQALVANEVQLGLIPESSANTMGERFRALAVTGDSRRPARPDVPTFRELGFPQIRGLAYSLNAPAGTPRAAIEKLHAAASRALKQPELRERMAKMGFEVTDQTPEVAAAALADEAKFMAEVAQRIGLQPQ